MTYRPRAKPVPLAKIVQNVYPGRAPEDLGAIRIFAWWDRAVPPRIAANARPVRLTNGTLIVHCRTSAWANDLEFVRVQLLQSAQRFAPQTVKALKIRVGPVPEMTLRRKQEDDVLPVPLSQLPGELARALAGIHDDTVRETVARTAATSLGRKEAASRKPRR